MKFLLFALLTTLAACQGATTANDQDGKAAVGGKGVDSSSSCLGITNGIPTDASKYPAVVLLARAVNGGSIYCTGTFVAPNAVLTAAHCLDDHQTNGGPTDGMEAIIGNQPVAASKAYFPKWGGDANAEPYGDIAVLAFDSAVAPAVMKIGPKPATGTNFTIAGFGMLTADDTQGQTNPNLKFNAGTNQVAGFAEDVILSYGESGTGIKDAPGQASLGGSGDSGGPMIVGNDVVGSESAGSPTLTPAMVTGGQVFPDFAGHEMTVPPQVLSQIAQLVNSGRKIATDYHVDLNYPANLAWLKSLAAEGLNLEFDDGTKPASSPAKPAATPAVAVPKSSPSDHCAVPKKS